MAEPIVVAGLTDADLLAAGATGERDGPTNPPVIQSLKVKPVTADYNPYAKMLGRK